jgi:2-phosphoglycolate phosphatase
MKLIEGQFTGVQAVLFDLDGTLVDSAPDLAAAADNMRVTRGMPSLPLAHYRHMAGAGARGMLGLAFDLTPDHAEYDVYREEFFTNYERCLTERTTVFQGIETLIRDLKDRGLQWGVVTNKAARFTKPLTAAMPLFFDAGTIISGDTTAHAKPHPMPLLEAARVIGVAPHNCVYVGDDKRDIVAGLAADMGTVVARYGYLGQKQDVLSWGAHAAIDQAHELLALIKP